MFDLNLLPFFLSMIALTVIVLAIGIHFWRNTLIMFIIIPVALFCAFSGYNTVVNILGYPVQQTIPEDALYLSHVQNGDGTELFVWVIEPEQMLPKNFRIPATDNNKKQMKKAQGQSSSGVPQVIRPGGKERDGKRYNPGEYRAYDFQVDPRGLK